MNTKYLFDLRVFFWPHFWYNVFGANLHFINNIFWKAVRLQT